MNTTADAVVVGAGVIGSSIALELARDGLSVVVVEQARAAPVRVPQARRARSIRFNYSTWDGIATAWEAKHCWEKWADHLEGVDEAGMARFHRVGMVFLDVDMAPEDRVLRQFDTAGIPYEIWDADRAGPASAGHRRRAGTGRPAGSRTRLLGETRRARSARCGPLMPASSTTPPWRRSNLAKQR